MRKPLNSSLMQRPTIGRKDMKIVDAGLPISGPQEVD